MAKELLDGVSRCIRRVALTSENSELTDGLLLERYVEYRDEAAFEALLRRHGPMVLGVCRRVLRHEADARDAFQATFVVLIRRAGTIEPRSQVGNWLYGVACKTSVKVLAMNRRVNAKRVHAVNFHVEPDQSTDPEVLAALDRELSHLPDNYRTVIVLCELEGKSLKEAARQLECPQGTVASRLARARTMLAKRMRRHGLATSVAAITAAITREGSAAYLPPSLCDSTAKVATLIAAGHAATVSAIAPKVAAITERMVKTMLLSKLKLITATTLAVTAIGGTFFGYQAIEAHQPAVPVAAAPISTETPEQPGDTPKKTGDKSEAKHGFLGVILTNGQEDRSILVHEVFPNSPAETAGIKPGDEVLKIADKSFKDQFAAADLLKKMKPGDKVALQIKRDGKELDMTVTLSDRPAEDQLKPKTQPQAKAPPGFIGLAIRNGQNEGAVEIDHIFPDSPAAKSNVKADDVLLLVNGEKPKDAEAVITQLSGLKAGDKVSLHLKRGDKEIDVSIVADKRPKKSGPM